MKKQLLLATTTLTLMMTGCAQKKLNTSTTTGENVPTNNGANLYQNVDPMGGQLGQGNGVYGNSSGIYGDASVQNIYFNADQYSITSEKLGQVSQNANLLRNNGKIKLEGHCDASGSDEYNYALGLKRAKATKDALVSNGISPNNITLVSMGESSPECATSASADCYAKNRRVEFKVLQ